MIQGQVYSDERKVLERLFIGWGLCMGGLRDVFMHWELCMDGLRDVFVVWELCTGGFIAGIRLFI